MFAGSCIGVICLVISLEFLRRVQREYEAFNRRRDQKSPNTISRSTDRSVSSSEENSELGASKDNATVRITRGNRLGVARSEPARMMLLKRQLIRSALHMVQFGVA